MQRQEWEAWVAGAGVEGGGPGQVIEKLPPALPQAAACYAVWPMTEDHSLSSVAVGCLMGVGQGGRDEGEKGYVSNLGWHRDGGKAEQLCAAWRPGSLKAGNWSGTLAWGVTQVHHLLHLPPKDAQCLEGALDLTRKVEWALEPPFSLDLKERMTPADI